MIAAFVQPVEMIIERVSETLCAAMGVYLPLIPVDCAILGAVLFMTIREYTMFSGFMYGFGSAIGRFLVILAMSGTRRKLKNVRIPHRLEGPGITLIITGMMALAFIGFAGMRGLGEFIFVEPHFEVRVDSVRGKLPCPFRHPGIFPKTNITVKNKEKNSEVTFTDLHIHLVNEHGFYEGKGSVFRLDPPVLADVLEIEPEV
jgi:hypothetical protein